MDKNFSSFGRELVEIFKFLIAHLFMGPPVHTNYFFSYDPLYSRGNNILKYRKSFFKQSIINSSSLFFTHIVYVYMQISNYN
jgi:hypothetical protein